MSETTKWILGILTTALLLVGMIYLELEGSRRQSAAALERKRQALEDAKAGWVYVCGWSCRWERIK